MIYKNLEFHNVAELEEREGVNGLILQRFPKEVREVLGIKEYERGRYKSQESTGCEIRFSSTSNAFIIGITSLLDDGEILIYKGDYFYKRIKVNSGKIETILVENPERFEEIDLKKLKKIRFSQNIWRVLISKGQIVFNYLDSLGGKITPPLKNEKPEKIFLAYGSSITHGRNTSIHSNSYIEQAAKYSKMDVLCKGVSGSCYIEKEMIDYLFEEKYDYFSLELGINMVKYFSEEEFKRRVEYIFFKFKEDFRKIILITPFLYHLDLSYVESEKTKKLLNFRNILRELYEKYRRENIFYVDGRTILKNSYGLTTDLTHPSDDGHIIMGINFGKILNKIEKKEM